MSDLISYTYDGFPYLIHAGLSEQSEIDIIHEQRSYEWDFPISTAIDVGAHIGSWSIRAKQLNPLAQILAVEVDPINFALLCINAASYDDIRPWLARVGYVAGAYVLERNPLNTGSTAVRPADSALHNARDVVTAPTMSIETLMQMSGMKHLDVLKLDCEGSEIEILKHITDDCLGKIGRIVGEIHTTPEKFNWDTEGRLFKEGFRMVFQQHPGNANLFYMHAWRES